MYVRNTCSSYYGMSHFLASVIYNGRTMAQDSPQYNVALLDSLPEVRTSTGEADRIQAEAYKAGQDAAFMRDETIVMVAAAAFVVLLMIAFSGRGKGFARLKLVLLVMLGIGALLLAYAMSGIGGVVALVVLGWVIQGFRSQG